MRDISLTELTPNSIEATVQSILILFYIVNKIGKFTYNDQRLVSKTNNCPTVRSKLLKKEVEPSNSSSNNGTGANVFCLLLT